MAVLSAQVPLEQSGFEAGINRDLPTPGSVWELINGIPDPEGPIKRGGNAYISTTAALGGLRWVWAGELRVGVRRLIGGPTDLAVIGADDVTPTVFSGSFTAPEAPSTALVDDLLFIAPGYVYGGSRKASGYSTGTVTVTAGDKQVTGAGTSWLANVDPGMIFAPEGGNATRGTYVVESVESNTSLTLTQPAWANAAPGSDYDLAPLYEIPAVDDDDFGDYHLRPSPFYLAVDGRLVQVVPDENEVVGNEGQGGAGATDERHDKVRFSTLKKYDANMADAGNDELYKPGDFDKNDFHRFPGSIVGLGSIQQTVFVFTTLGTFSLDGLALNIVDPEGNPQHRIRQVGRDVVLAGRAGLAGYRRALIVPAVDGIYLIDGDSSPQRISSPIAGLYRYYIDQGYALGQATVYEGYYLLPILNSGTVVDVLAVNLDRAFDAEGVAAWFHIQGGGAQAAYTVDRTAGESALLGGDDAASSRLTDCSGYLRPTAAIDQDADGSDIAFDLISAPFESPNRTINAFRKLAASYELEGTGADVDWSYTTEREPAPGGSFTWTALTPSGDVDADGTLLAKARINKKERSIRIRVQQSNAAEWFRLRRIELRVRPSEAVRR